MTALRKEAGYLGRYAGSGALNTLAGFATIFALMGFGATPLLANVAGYLVGLVLGFFVSRKFVFVSQGHVTTEAAHYLLAFMLCFALNLLALQFALERLQLNAYLAQIFSAVAYTTSMYLLTRWLVFSPGADR
ncbi:MAG: GtrA family protein [Gallionella sp.]|nr:GtrA family protein [Gallionella sp.]